MQILNISQKRRPKQEIGFCRRRFAKSYVDEDPLFEAEDYPSQYDKMKHFEPVGEEYSI
jgi:hypothetical protein